MIGELKREAQINEISWDFPRFGLSIHFPHYSGTRALIDSRSRNRHLQMTCVYLEESAFISICLPHWGRVKHICVGKLIIIGSDSGLSLGQRQAIIWTNAGILLIGPLGTNFSQILIGIQPFSFNHFQCVINALRCEQNTRRYADDIFNSILLIEHVCILIEISLKFIPKSSVDNKAVWIQIRVLCPASSEPLPESAMAKFFGSTCRLRANAFNESKAMDIAEKLVGHTKGLSIKTFHMMRTLYVCAWSGWVTVKLSDQVLVKVYLSQSGLLFCKGLCLY